MLLLPLLLLPLQAFYITLIKPLIFLPLITQRHPKAARLPSTCGDGGPVTAASAALSLLLAWSPHVEVRAAGGALAGPMLQPPGVLLKHKTMARSDSSSQPVTCVPGYRACRRAESSCRT